MAISKKWKRRYGDYVSVWHSFAMTGKRHSYLDTAEDIQWLRDVHLPGLPSTVKAALLYGNEDSPEHIDVYFVRKPNVDSPSRGFHYDPE